MAATKAMKVTKQKAALNPAGTVSLYPVSYCVVNSSKLFSLKARSLIKKQAATKAMKVAKQKAASSGARATSQGLQRR